MQFARFTRILRVLLFIKPAHTQEDRLNKALLGSALTTFWAADRELDSASHGVLTYAALDLSDGIGADGCAFH